MYIAAFFIFVLNIIFNCGAYELANQLVPYDAQRLENTTIIRPNNGQEDLNDFNQTMNYVREEFKFLYIKQYLEKHDVDKVFNFLKENKFKILPHITRKFHEDMFDENGALKETQNEMFLYNIWYRVVHEHQFIPFRRDHEMVKLPNKINFYTSGATQKTMMPVFGKIDQGSKNVQVSPPVDIYKIRTFLIDFEDSTSKDLSKPVLITPNFYNGHATFMLHFLDLEKHQIKQSFFINTWNKSEYYQEMIKRLNLKHLTTNKKQFSLIDCSYDIQVAENDFNCSLYTYALAKAYTKLFQDDEIVNRVLRLVQGLQGDSGERKSDPLQDVKEILQNDVKKHLPEYFNADGSIRCAQEIKLYHLKLRWDISCDWFRSVFD